MHVVVSESKNNKHHAGAENVVKGGAIQSLESMCQVTERGMTIGAIAGITEIRPLHLQV